MHTQSLKIAEPIPLLAPLFTGAWAEYGAMLACPATPSGAATAVASLVEDRQLLNAVLERHARSIDALDADPRAIASAWSLRYLWALLPPVAAAASVLQHVFPIAAAEAAVVLDDDGAPLQFHIPHEGFELRFTETALRYQALLELHLDPLFTAINALTRIPEKILWGNTARYLEIILDEALRLTGYAPEIVADKAALLQNPNWPDGRSNRLYMRQHMRQREVPFLEREEPANRVVLHRQCCLAYLLPGEDHCGACPLAPQFREITA